MSIVATSETQSGRAALGDVSFVHWALRDEPPAALAMIAVLAAVVWLTAAATASATLAAGAFVAVAAAGRTALLPARYRLDAAGIEISMLGLKRRIAWAAVERCELSPTGVRLFRSAERQPLESLRSVFLPFAGRRQAVLEQLQRRASRCATPDPRS